jgi:hypothetical protein
MFKHVLLYIFVLVALPMFSQGEEPGHPILDNFSVIEIGGKVFVSVTVGQGNTCSGINVLRSDNQLSYDTVGHVSGVCGSTSHPITYSFTDATPVKNRTSYYKVELGGVGYTTVIAMLIIDTEEFGFQIRPNPAVGDVIIHFENDNNEQVEFSLYSLTGHHLKSISTINDFVQLNVSEFENGMYIFMLKEDSDRAPVKGKLIVKH